MLNSGPAWYCARTKPKHEHLAAASVSRLFGLEVFQPRLRLERVTRRGKVRLCEPLFPCYIFVRCLGAEDLDSIRYATGISSLVQFGQDIPTVPDLVLEELRRCFEREEPGSTDSRLQAGAKTTIFAGPFLASQGLVVRVVPPRQRVQVLLEFLGRKTWREPERKSFAIKDERMTDLVPALFAGP